MKKRYARSALGLITALFLFAQPVEACTGFIIGKKLTADGNALYGRTEDLEPNHNKNFVVRERTYNKKGDVFEDATNGFKYELPEVVINIQLSQMLHQNRVYLMKLVLMSMVCPSRRPSQLQQMTTLKRSILM